MPTHNLIVITGPTAVGKTRLAALLARQINGEIISADSRQVYRGMDIGTGKDYNDYNIEGQNIPSHLIDICDPGEEYNVFRFQQDFATAYQDISSRKKLPILCGGTGLYIEAVIGGYSLLRVPENKVLRNTLAQKTMEELKSYLIGLKPLHNTTDITDRERTLRAIEIAEFELHNAKTDASFPPIQPLIISVDLDRTLLRQKITNRLKQRLEEGMVHEVEVLLRQGIKPEILDYYGLEYRYISQYITGRISYNEMFTLLNTAIHQFAKRQMTWYRRMEKKGFVIHWIDGKQPMDERLEQCLKIIAVGLSQRQ